MPFSLVIGFTIGERGRQLGARTQAKGRIKEMKNENASEGKGNTSIRKQRRTIRRKLSDYAKQRAEWIAQGLCAIDGKHKIWVGHSTCECRKHFLYYRDWARKAAASSEKRQHRHRSKLVQITPKRLIQEITKEITRKLAKAS
jgi:hypothetical protein